MDGKKSIGTAKSGEKFSIKPSAGQSDCERE